MKKTLLKFIAATLLFGITHKSSGQVLLKDIKSGTNSGFMTYNGSYNDDHPFNIVWEKNGFIFFTANSSGSSTTNDLELWKSDGTQSGTTIVKDIDPGATGSNPKGFIDIGGTLYFNADDGVNGRELWKTDGTTAGTVMVKDIYPGAVGCFNYSTGSYYDDFAFSPVWIQGNTFYFVASDYCAPLNSGSYTLNEELWKSDGTAAGTVKVKDIRVGNEGSYPQNFYVNNNTLYFVCDDGIHGRELWKTDGSTAGTVMVKEIMSGTYSAFELIQGGSSSTFNFDVVWTQGNTFFFIANDYTYAGASYYDNNIELWKSDGTTAGTVKVKEVRAGNFGSRERSFSVINNSLYFVAGDGINGDELWKTDGTAAGTVMVKDIYPGADGGFTFSQVGSAYDLGFSPVWIQGNTFYFIANSYTFPGGAYYDNDVELWKSDGTSTGTVRVKDINTTTSGSYPAYFTVINNVMYFSAFDWTHGRELWRSDGTAAGTYLLKDILAGSESGFSYSGQNIYYDFGFNVDWIHGNSFYFSANDYASVPNGGTATNNPELWKSDGTPAGTVKVKEIYPGNDGSWPRNCVDIGGTLYFVAINGTNGAELWRSDGSTNGTYMLKDIYTGNNSGFELQQSTYNWQIPFGNAFSIGNQFYFTANDNGSFNGSYYDNNVEIWKSNATTAGTSKLSEIYPGNVVGSYPKEFARALGKIFFTATDNIHGRELFTIDAPTVSVDEIENNAEFRIYPNPSTSYFIIDSEKSFSTSAEVVMYDITGKEIQNIHFTGNSTRINTENLKGGMYVVKIKSSDYESKPLRYIKIK